MARSSVRRCALPPRPGWRLGWSAACSGAGVALAGVVMAIVAVTVCWLPAAGARGSAGSAIRAGILTFLAALHGGVTIDGVAMTFVPLGLPLLVGMLAWRAGRGLAGAGAVTVANTVAGSASAEPRVPKAALVRAGAIQLGAFTLVCAVSAAVVSLGTSAVSPLAVLPAAAGLFAVSGTVAFVRYSPLAEPMSGQLPVWLVPAVRAGTAAVVVYLGAGALLVAGSLLAHRERVELLSGQFGGWAGLPVLLLGLLTAPNAVVAGASFLAGPGFALGHGTTVSPGSSVHGTLPEFPILGAVPTGATTPTTAGLVIAGTALVAGVVFVTVIRRVDRICGRWRLAGAGVAVAIGLAVVLGWRAGGSLGSGRLSTVGPSPWRFGLAVGVALTAVAVPALAMLTVLKRWRGHSDAPTEPRTLLTVVSEPTGEAAEAGEVDEMGEMDEAHGKATEVAGNAPTGGQLAG